MARVPGLPRRVQEETLPGARISATPGAGAFGGTEAELITQIGGAAAQFGVARQKAQREFKDRRDKLHATESVLKYKDWWREQKGTYLNKFRLDADGVTETAKTDTDKFIRTLLDTAENDEQRILIEMALRPEQDVGLDKTQSHEVTEFRTSEKEAIAAMKENIIRDAADSHDNPTALHHYGQELIDVINAETRGMSRAQKNNVTAEIVSDFHLSILNSKVVEDAEGAKTYYSEHEKDILPENREAVEKVLNTHDTMQFSQQKATELILLHPDDYAKQLEEARKIENPEKQDATVKRLKTRKTERDQLDKEAKIVALDNATEGVRNAATLEDALDHGITGADGVKLDALANARFKEKVEKIETDPVVQENLNRGVTTGEIRTFNQYIRESEGNISNADLKKVPDFIAKGGRVGNLSEEKLRSQFNNITGEQPQENPALYKRVRDYVIEQIELTGLEPTPVNMNEWINNAVTEGEIVGSGIFWDDEMTLVAASQAGKVERYLPFINDEDVDGGQERREINAAYAKRGIVTDNENDMETLRRLYKKEVILRIPLSTNEADQLRRLIRKIGILRPISR